MLAFTNISWNCEHCDQMSVWGLDLHMEYGLVHAEVLYPRTTKPVLGRSLVFMITARSGYETVLKDPTQFFFFKFYFHIFKTLAVGFQNFCKK
jgi:hypothetical protein